MARSSCVALLLAAALVACDAFVSPQARWVPASMSARRSGQRPVVALKTTPHLLPSISTTARRAAASDDDATAAEPATPPAVPEDLDYYDGLLGQQPGADKAAAASQGDGSASTTDYPIPLPSYLLLALATVLSIAFTGSIFEVTGGHPELGYPATYVIGTLSLPSFIFLFYAAIKKGQAEVEEDDAKFKQGRW